MSTVLNNNCYENYISERRDASYDMEPQKVSLSLNLTAKIAMDMWIWNVTVIRNITFSLCLKLKLSHSIPNQPVCFTVSEMINALLIYSSNLNI